jgi:hypothetical protein
MSSNRTRTIVTHLYTFFVLFMLSAHVATGVQYPNPLNPGGEGEITTIPAFLALVLNGLSLLLMPLVVIFIIYAGYLFVTAQGEEGKIQKARSALLWTIIGAGVILGAQIMARILQDTLTEFNQP